MSLSKRLCPLEEFRRIENHYPQLTSTGCTRSFCQSGRMVHTDEQKLGNERCAETVESEATDFLRQLRRDGVIDSDDALEKRLASVLGEIRHNSVVLPSTDARGPTTLPGAWHQTPQELEHGLRLSWKHARKCIMRSEYSYLKLHDLRHVTTSKEMGQAILKGMHHAFNGGDINPSVFVFPPRKPNQPGPMVWNQQFLAFAGYRQPDKSVLGDPMSVGITQSIMALGWKPPAMRTRWDLLPLVTMMDGDEPYITEIPQDLFPLVHIRHPRPELSLAFDKLGLRWVPAPALSQLGFDIGGVQYTAAPFIGWFMDAEIGVRDLADSFRYDVLPSVVSALKLLQPGQELDQLPKSEQLALLSHAQTELNYAVNWSFADAGVRMSDSLTASAMYTNFDDDHVAKHGFRLPADPYWLSPPQGSVVPIWHRGAAPNYQPKPMISRLQESPTKVWQRLKAEKAKAVPKANGLSNGLSNGHSNGLSNGISHCPAHAKAMNGELLNGNHVSMPTIRIFYCSAGTTAQRLAAKLEQKLGAIMRHTNESRSIAAAAPLNRLELDTLVAGDLVFIVASSNGRGEVPINGQSILQQCTSLDKIKASEVSFCIFGNGNSSYGENFNGGGIKIQTALEKVGLASDIALFQGDTLKEDPPWRQFESWLAILRATYFDITDSASEVSEDMDMTDDSCGLPLDQLSPAEVISIQTPNASGMKHVALDVGSLRYSHMSHIDVFVPLSKETVEDLLWTARLTGKEVLTFGDQQVSTRQLLSLMDLEAPFRSLKWASKLGLGLSSEEAAKLGHNPMSNSIRNLPVGWQANAKRGGFSDFFQALPTRRPRTFSAASSQMYWDTLNMGNVLELTLQTHTGGLFTDRFLTNAKRGDQLYVRIRHGPGEHLVHDPKPLIAFTTGSGIAPLRGLLQARCAHQSADSKVKAAPRGKVSLFLGFHPGDTEIINESVREAMALGLVDMLHQTPSNPAKERAQNKMFQEGVSSQIRTKIRDEGASVFVCASKEAADDFARNLEAVVGVKSIREALGERWVEEVYVCTQG